MADGTGKAALFDQMARLGKALGNGKRLELVDLLSQADHSVEELVRITGMGVTTVSAHLQTLKAAGVAVARRRGQMMIYSLAGDDVAGLYRSVRDVAFERIAEVERAARAYLGDEPETISRDALVAAVEKGDVVVLDVRPGDEYEAGHIPGAVSIPLEQLGERLGELPEGARVAAYCRGAFCVLAHDAVRLLEGAGRKAVKLQDGILEWRLEDLPVETGRG
ncbi:ArsR/SmtB family transcription factor [Salininema proteolyticum]|uniref:ArsR/SmtB family transcription factor n=1 Tax=Salininema proteolyticum TaxID=1607685 RepID=A0ABV8TYV6_9ACTN